MGDGTEIQQTMWRNAPWAGIRESALRKCRSLPQRSGLQCVLPYHGRKPHSNKQGRMLKLSHPTTNFVVYKLTANCWKTQAHGFPVPAIPRTSTQTEVHFDELVTTNLFKVCILFEKLHIPSMKSNNVFLGSAKQGKCSFYFSPWP